MRPENGPVLAPVTLFAVVLLDVSPEQALVRLVIDGAILDVSDVCWRQLCQLLRQVAGPFAEFFVYPDELASPDTDLRHAYGR